jgi:cyclopropane fatty-acyl-phospholipid synthase-like methyltransferase
MAMMATMSIPIPNVRVLVPRRATAAALPLPLHESPFVPIGDENDRDAIASWLCVSEGDHVLDVCAGSGAFAIAIARQGARVTGIDRSRRYVDLASREAARRRVNRRCDFICSSLEVQHPLPIYDMLTSFLGLSELLKKKPLTEVLRTMQRRVRSNGRIILIEQFPDDVVTAGHRQGLEANAEMGHAYVSLGGLLASARDVGLTFQRSLRLTTSRNIVRGDGAGFSIEGKVDAVLRVVELRKASPS